MGKSEFIYGNLNSDIMYNHKLIINCSPVGTFPNINLSPNIPYKYLDPSHILFDMVYNPAQSLFLKKGTKKGCKTKNGLEMLEIQAEESWRIWEGF